MAGILGSIFGSRDKLRQLPTMDPFQQQAFQRMFQNPINESPLYSSGASYLQQLLSGSPESTQAFEAPYLQQFNQQIVPQIAERFAGMGTGAGAGNSSALYNSLSQAGGNLQTNLAGLRSGLQMQALPQALGYAQQPYSNTLAASQVSPFAYQNQRGQQGLLGGITGGLGQGAGMGLGLGAGGPLASYFSSLFGGGQQSPFGNQDVLNYARGLRG